MFVCVFILGPYGQLSGTPLSPLFDCNQQEHFKHTDTFHATLPQHYHPRSLREAVSGCLSGIVCVCRWVEVAEGLLWKSSALNVGFGYSARASYLIWGPLVHVKSDFQESLHFLALEIMLPTRE